MSSYSGTFKILMCFMTSDVSSQCEIVQRLKEEYFYDRYIFSCECLYIVQGILIIVSSLFKTFFKSNLNNFGESLL